MAETKDDKAEDNKQPNATAEYLGLPDARNFAVEENDLGGYIGVSPEYMTYADETQKPISTDEEVIPTIEQLMFEEEAPANSEPEASTEEKTPTDDGKDASAPAATAKPSTSAKSSSTSK